MKIDRKYDAIIIGSGIGGLTCGCYLAKNGLKVLIAEKHSRPGGYCASFTRKCYNFDAAVHSLRGVTNKKQIGIILNDLNLKKKIRFEKINPSDIIIFGDKKLYIYNNVLETKNSFKTVFPKHQREIDSFFSFLCFDNFVKVYQLTFNLTFRDILDRYFTDEDIKFCFNILLGNLGLDARRISALSAIVFLEELFTDGGYYPENGLQSFSDTLAEKFCEYGGAISYANEAKQIIIKDHKVQGVILEKNNHIGCKIIVSNIDAHVTYLKLIGEQHTNNEFKKYVSKLIVSPSAFIVYLGITKKINIDRCCTLWYFPFRNVANCYQESFNNKTNTIGKYIIFGFSSVDMRPNLLNHRNAISLTSIAPWKTPKYWIEKKDELSRSVINMACNFLNFSESDIDVKEIATPLTLYNYTSNYNGALYGWASVPNQINKSVMPQKSRISGLYLCGHWATRGWGQGGISMVANSGRTTAEMIFKNYINN